MKTLTILLILLTLTIGCNIDNSVEAELNVAISEWKTRMDALDPENKWDTTYMYFTPTYELLRQRDNLTVPYRALLTYTVMIITKTKDVSSHEIDMVWEYRDGKWSRDL